MVKRCLLINIGLVLDMDYTIRKLKETEYPLLKDFLYEVIFVPDGVEAPPKSIVDIPQLQVYIFGFGPDPHDVALIAAVVGGESDRNTRPLDYAWVLSIREQCIAHKVHFEFRQCGTHFIKDGKSYTLSTRNLCSQARKADINY